MQFILSELNPESDLVLGKYVLGYSVQPERMCVLMIIYCSKLGTGDCVWAQPHRAAQPVAISWRIGDALSMGWGGSGYNMENLIMGHRG